MTARSVYTTCRYCESACALDVRVDNNKVVKIVADKKHPQSWKDICAKGLTAHEVVEHPRRLRSPMKRVGDQYIPVSYEEAVSGIAAELKGIIERDGKDAVGYYHGNPLGFTSGILFALGLIDGIATRNRFNVGSVDQNNNHVVTQAMFGLPYVPFNPDVDHCDFFLLLGMNPAESRFSWLGSASDGWERALQRQCDGATIVLLDPRCTRTAARADLHIMIKPGQDWAFLLVMLKVIFAEKLTNEKAISQLPVDQLNMLKEITLRADSAELSERCGVELSMIEKIARQYAQAKRAMCLTQTGVSMHTTGTLGHWLGMVLDVVCAHLDKPGGRRYDSGYINMTKLAAENLSENTLSRVRKQPAVMGNQSLCELPDEILTPGEGQIKAMIIHCGNPVVSGPNGALLDKALESLELLVAVDLVQRESHRHAHWLIPAEHWLERSELPFNLAGAQDKPFVQYSPRALEAPTGIRPEWRFFTDLALAMDVPMLGRKGVNGTIKFSRWLARTFKRPAWEFSPTMIEKLMLKTGKKVSWKQLEENPHGFEYTQQAYGLLQKEMGDRTLQIAPQQFCKELLRLLDEGSKKEARFPLLLIGERSLHMMNSWLMELPNMQKRQQYNCCEIHPDDAQQLGIQSGDKISVRSVVGQIQIEALLSDKVRPGVVCIQHGWGSRVFAPGQAGEQPWCFGVNRNLLVDNQQIDPFSGIPNLNSTRVCVEKLH